MYCNLRCSEIESHYFLVRFEPEPESVISYISRHYYHNY